MGNIYFRKEAEEWNQAFPIGNGFLGAMVFGNVAKERIQVNEDSVWSGGFSNRVNPDAGRYLEKIRECLFEGNVQEAEKLAEQSMYATSPNMRVYQPLGDIWIRFMDQEAERKLARDESGLPYLKESAAEVEAYQRILNLEQAVGKIEYCVGRTKWNREFFASNPAKWLCTVFVQKVERTLTLRYLQPEKTIDQVAEVSFCDRILAEENQYIWLEGSSGGREGIGLPWESSLFLWGKAISDGKPYYCRKGKKSSDLFYGKNDISICRTETMVQRASGFIISGHVCREKKRAYSGLSNIL